MTFMTLRTLIGSFLWLGVMTWVYYDKLRQGKDGLGAQQCDRIEHVGHTVVLFKPDFRGVGLLNNNHVGTV